MIHELFLSLLLLSFERSSIRPLDQWFTSDHMALLSAHFPVAFFFHSSFDALIGCTDLGCEYTRHFHSCCLVASSNWGVSCTQMILLRIWTKKDMNYFVFSIVFHTFYSVHQDQTAHEQTQVLCLIEMSHSLSVLNV